MYVGKSLLEVSTYSDVTKEDEIPELQERGEGKETSDSEKENNERSEERNDRRRRGTTDSDRPPLCPPKESKK